MSRSRFRPRFVGTFLVVLALAPGCSFHAREPAETTPLQPAQERWWGRLQDLCGEAFAGRVVSDDPADSAMASEPLVMHVARCTQDRIEIPFHVGSDRSRTWLLTRTGLGIQLQHDHRHHDGTPDAVTLYGGHTEEWGSRAVQSFPADDYSRDLFRRQGLDASATNVWTMEIEPGELFAYGLDRPGRHFRAEFDLGQPVAVPPPAWGHEQGEP